MVQRIGNQRGASDTWGKMALGRVVTPLGPRCGHMSYGNWVNHISSSLVGRSTGTGKPRWVVCKVRTKSLCPPETTQTYAACLHYGSRKTSFQTKSKTCALSSGKRRLSRTAEKPGFAAHPSGHMSVLSIHSNCIY